MQIHPLFFLPPLKNPPPSLTHAHKRRPRQTKAPDTNALAYSDSNLLHVKAQVIWTVAGISRAVLSAFHLDSFTAVTSRDCGSFCFVLDDCVKIQQLSEIMVIEVMQQCSNRITECRGERTMPCNIIFEFYQRLMLSRASAYICVWGVPSPLHLLKSQNYDITI